MGTPLIYQMSETVYDALTICASNEYYTFAVLEPSETSDSDRRDRLLKDLEEIKDLVQLGLLRDISAKYNKEIAKYLQEYGSSYKVVELTKEGILMFSNAKDRVIN